MRQGSQKDRWAQDQWSLEWRDGLFPAVSPDPSTVLGKVYHGYSISVCCTLMNKQRLKSDAFPATSPPPLLPALSITDFYSPLLRSQNAHRSPPKLYAKYSKCIFLSKEMLDTCPEKLLNKHCCERQASTGYSVGSVWPSQICILGPSL